MPTNSKIWNRLANGYSKKKISNEGAYQKKLEVTRRYLTPDSKVLEFGCGTGSTAIAHAPFVEHVLATDFSKRMIEIARQKLADQNTNNVTFERSEIGALQGVDGYYDMVMGHSFLHLLEDRDTAITKVFEHLKPGGVFVSSTACLGGSMRLMRPLLWVGNFARLLPLVRFLTKTRC